MSEFNALHEGLTTMPHQSSHTSSKLSGKQNNKLRGMWEKWWEKKLQKNMQLINLAKRGGDYQEIA